MDCLFCKFVSGEIPVSKVYEDDDFIIIRDINPQAKNHFLAIPKKHFKDLDDIDLETLTHIMKVAKDIKLRIEERLNPDGLRLLQNNGTLQDVKHFHLHIIPSYKEDKD